MNKPSLRIIDSALLTLLVAGAATTMVACSKEEPKRAAWSCTNTEVPMGEVVRCSSAALTSDGPPIDSTGGSTTTTSGGTGTTDGTTDGTTGLVDGTTSFPTQSDIGSGDGSGITSTTTDGTNPDGSIVYTCSSDSTNPDCPPADLGSGDGSGTTGDGSGTTGDGTTADGTAGSSGSSGSNVGSGDGSGTTDGSSGSNAGGNGNGNGNGNGGSNVGSGSGNGTTGNGGGQTECSYVPDLPYCGGAAGEGGSAGDGTSSSGGSADCTSPSCDAPGKTKDGTNSGTTSSSGGSSSGGSSSGDATGSSGNGNGTKDGSNGGASSSSSGGSGKGKGNGHEWVCKKDKKGNKACQSVPTCAPGTHPSACGACVSDSDGSADCVPPSAGGCWVTGGGFVVAPNLVSGAAEDGHDNFGGNAKPMKDGSIKGHWNHVDHGTGNHANGRPSYIYCRHVDEPGPGGPGAKKGFTMNQVYFGGPAEWRDAATGAWGAGYWFDVVAKDHGEPGSQPKAKNGFMPDTYHFTIRLVDDPANNASGTKIYETAGTLEGGNIQLHPPNNGHPAVQSTLPAWVSLEP